MNEALQIDPALSVDDVKAIFHKWKWTWKIASHIQVQKYLPQNMERYGQFVTWFCQADWRKVKFLDEVHFSSKNVAKSTAVGPVNQRVIRLNWAPIDTRMSVTAITTPERENKPIEIWAREDSNNAQNFVEFVLYCLEEHILENGDVLVCDNSSVHGGDNTLAHLDTILQVFGVTMYFLPTYSPELNPIEMVFGFVKTYLRGNTHDDDVFIAIMDAFAHVEKSHITSFYEHCANEVLRE